MKVERCLARCVVLLALLPAAWAAQAECPMPSALSSVAPVQVRWSTQPAAVQVGEPFLLNLELCPAAVKLVGVDASMPDHRHGMNYKPSFKPAGEGLWRVEGMVWHMAGRWELKLDTELNGVAHRFTPSVVLK